MNPDPTKANHPDAASLSPGSVDNLGRAVLTLTRELCVLTDRVLVLEALLARQGSSGLADEIDRHQPDDELKARIAQSTSAIVAAVIADLSEPRH